MFISDFDYELPPELIARYPASDRRGSRLLAVGDDIADLGFAELPSLLRAGDLLVFNDTRVIKARLAARKETGGKAEILVERIENDRVALVHIRASKSPKPGSRLMIQGGAEATVVARDDDLFVLKFSVDLLPYLDAHGDVPLPPYLEREADETDVERYQTVYARDPGAVAAPTAGLHFDDAMLDETLAAGTRHVHVTLHVGAGTFQSLREEHIEENRRPALVDISGRLEARRLRTDPGLQQPAGVPAKVEFGVEHGVECVAVESGKQCFGGHQCLGVGQRRVGAMDRIGEAGDPLLVVPKDATTDLGIGEPAANRDHDVHPGELRLILEERDVGVDERRQPIRPGP